jgi:hypothetical protein
MCFEGGIRRPALSVVAACTSLPTGTNPNRARPGQTVELVADPARLSGFDPQSGEALDGEPASVTLPAWEGNPQSPPTAFTTLPVDNDAAPTRFEGYQPARTIITLQGACSETLLDTLPSR